MYLTSSLIRIILGINLLSGFSHNLALRTKQNVSENEYIPIIKRKGEAAHAANSTIIYKLKGSILWDIISCSPLKISRRFGGTFRLQAELSLLPVSRWLLVWFVFQL
jgi:hypothetical protein